MKLRYYLRGLGIGIFVTALIMTITSGSKGAMTDEEIIQRAMELGMVNSSKTLISQVQEESSQTADGTEASTEESLPEMTQEPMKSSEETSTEALSESKEEDSEGASDSTIEESLSENKKETTEEPAESTIEEPVESTTKEPAESVTEEPLPEITKEPTEQGTALHAEAVTLTVYKGEHSATVARRMEELGLIDDYSDFDDYLCDKGYSRKVNSGVYKIKPGLSYEELAKIITRTK